MRHTAQNYITHQCTVQWPSRAFCTDYQEQSHQSHGRRGRSTFSYPLIHHNTLEPQSTSPAELLNSRKFRCLLPFRTQQQDHTHQYRRMMQHQKHEQARDYNKSARDLPSLKTGNAVYIQLVPNVRRWIPATVFQVLSARLYRVRTIKGGIYIRNRKFIRVKHRHEAQCQDYPRGHSTRWEHYTSQQAQEDHEKTTKTHRVNELYPDKIYTEKIHVTCKRLYF